MVKSPAEQKNVTNNTRTQSQYFASATQKQIKNNLKYSLFIWKLDVKWYTLKYDLYTFGKYGLTSLGLSTKQNCNCNDNVIG